MFDVIQISTNFDKYSHTAIDIINNNEMKLFFDFQIIPPKEFQFRSLDVDTRAIINVQHQGIQAIPFKSKTPFPAFELQFSSRITKTKYAKFLKTATAKDSKVEETAEQIENRFWANVTNRGKYKVQYSINNPISLFPAEHRYWNLNKFSECDSLIHGVCIL